MKKKDGFTPVEQLVDIVAIGQVEHPELSCGFYILQRKQAFRCVFALRTPGIHACQSPEAMADAYVGLVALCRDLPAGGRLSVRLSSFAESASRLAQLEQLRGREAGEPVDWLIAGEQQRVQGLAADGRRKVSELLLFACWGEWSAQAASRDWIDRVALGVQEWWLSYLGEGAAESQARLHRLVSHAHAHCRQWLHLLNLTARLAVVPLGAEELMAWAWKQFNTGSPPPPPRLLRLSGDELCEQLHGDLDFRSALFESPPRLSAEKVSIGTPEAGMRHCAVLVWDEKPSGFADPAAQLRYLWNLMARQEVVDTEIVVEISTVNERTSRDNAVRLQRQASAGLKTSQRQGKLVDVPQQLKLEEAAELEKSFIEGARPVYLAVCVLVWRSDPLLLAEGCRFISGFFNRPARVVREVSYAWKVFFQSLPFVWEGLLVAPFDRRLELLDEEAPGFLPLVRLIGIDREGVELLSEEGQTPLWLDLYRRHRNLALFGTTRSGKSVLLEALMRHALARRVPVVAMDFPKPDGSSTFSDLTAFVEGAYFDVGRHALNLFELPDLDGLEERVRAERLEEFQEFLVSALLVMVLGRDVQDPLLSQTVRSLLQLAVGAFFKDLAIRQRYEAATRAGPFTTPWRDYPSLPDLLPFFEAGRLGIDTDRSSLRPAFEHIRLRLTYWVGSRVGTRLSSPSTIRADAALLVFALRNVSNAEDMTVLALANYAAALRRALATPASLFILDEAPILFECAEIANLVGRLCANGAKAGVRVIISAQDPDTIEKAPNSSKIFQNLRTRLIGRIEASAIPSFARVFGYTPASLARNASAQFFPNAREVFSRWLLDDGGLLTPVRYYPSFRSLAVVANNPDEQREREAFLGEVGGRYPDRLSALSAFTEHYLRMLRDEPG
ncbi:hypothetical protein [Gloeobacter morelensis]|uniref:Helicase HerA central domain-containing protein n=1 Tax=Gloeobacter morelensis MG652769 TaxID=2781736 RepID=A0ABY3PI91_9CYAN|nr:hypothetical protein [Gloeobacter morelensis]UFP93362.1 hypothetical protein ISF26_16355 [Gloeobacter morelensis MG652769]